MGFFDKYKADNAGRKAYGLHVMGNRLYDQDKTAEAKAKHDALEAVYNPHVDFQRVEETAETIAGELLGEEGGR